MSHLQFGMVENDHEMAVFWHKQHVWSYFARWELAFLPNLQINHVNIIFIIISSLNDQLLKSNCISFALKLQNNFRNCIMLNASVTRWLWFRQIFRTRSVRFSEFRWILGIAPLMWCSNVKEMRQWNMNAVGNSMIAHEQQKIALTIMFARISRAFRSYLPYVYSIFRGIWFVGAFATIGFHFARWIYWLLQIESIHILARHQEDSEHVLNVKHAVDRLHVRMKCVCTREKDLRMSRKWKERQLWHWLGCVRFLILKLN